MNEKETKKSLGFRAFFYCSKCNESLSYNKIMDSKGVCTCCGNTSNSTIVDHVKKSHEVFEFTYLNSFLYFWEIEYKIQRVFINGVWHDLTTK